MLIEGWRRHYNTVRPHSSLGYRPQPRKRRHCHGAGGNLALTINAEHSVGAGQLELTIVLFLLTYCITMI